MGRWAQAARRGGSRPGDNPAGNYPLPAPTAGDIELDPADSGQFAVFILSSPPAATHYRCRWSHPGEPGTHLTALELVANPTTVSDLAPDDPYLVEVRWADVHQDLSAWSAPMPVNAGS